MFRQFNNDPIVELRTVAGLDMAAGSGGVVTASTTANGTLWIAAGYSLVNESETRQLNSALYLTGGPDGTPLITGNWEQNYSQWAFVPE